MLIVNVNLVLFTAIRSEAADCLPGGAAAPVYPCILAEHPVQVRV